MPFILAATHAPYALLLGLIAAVWLLARTFPELLRRAAPLPLLPWVILGWTASGLASTVLSGRDFAHYSIQILPGLSLACGWVSIRSWEAAGHWRVTGRRLVRGTLIAGILTLAGTALHRAATFDTTESLSRDIGQLIAAQTGPTDRIFVWGYEPELYVFSQRLPNTRFVYAVFLTGLIPWTNIDPLVDTDYAIVPGSWDDFWNDFEQRPPALIVDTQSNRGFLKYPLRRQERLWRVMEAGYVEVTDGLARSLGYRLYRRVAHLPDATTSLPPADDTLQLTGPARVALGSVQMQAAAPPGTTTVTLYMNGRAYRRVECPADRGPTLSFFISGDDLEVGAHEFQLVAEGASLRASQTHALEVVSEDDGSLIVQGPPIILPGLELSPIASESYPGGPVIFWPELGYWFAHAPSRLVYHRPPELVLFEFTLSFRPDAYDGSQPQKTDGVEIIVRLETEDGANTELYRRRLNPVEFAADRGPFTERVVIPGMAPGILSILITPGPMNNPAFDWIGVHNLRGEHSPMSLDFLGIPLPLVAYNAELGLNLINYADRRVAFAHAPATFDFPQPPGLSEVSGEFGLLDSAWQGPKKSAGAVFSVA